MANRSEIHYGFYNKAMDYRLEDIFDLRRFQALTDSFHRSTGIATALLDLDGKVLLGSGWQDICVEFHRKDPKSRLLCLQSDTHFNDTITIDQPYLLYECGHGLIDAASPVIVEGEHIGNFFTGQFLFKEKDAALRERFRRQAAEYGFDEAAYLKALEAVPVFSEERVREILDFLVELTGFVADACLANLRNQRLSAQLEDQVAARTEELENANRSLNDEIEERKIIEERLINNESRFRRLVEGSQDIHYSYSREKGIYYVSPQVKTTLGYDPDDLIKRPQLWHGSIHPEDTPLLREAISGFEKGRHFAVEYRIKDKSGEWLWFLDRSIGRYNFDGQDAIEGVVTDISESKRNAQALAEYADRLRNSNKELERFAYIASHDLQEPLRKIINFTELLAHRYKNQLDEKADRFIEYTVDAARRMSNLINDLLSFSRAGRSEYRRERFQSGEALETVLSDLELRIEAAGAVISCSDLPEINFNREVYMRIMQNLISNALKFAADRPLTIGISAGESPEEWRFAVEDNGLGIEEKDTGKIFEIFQRLHGREIPGTGIGLPLCRRLIERFGGRIWVESEPGLGSRFLFTIPKSFKRGASYADTSD